MGPLVNQSDNEQQIVFERLGDEPVVVKDLATLAGLGPGELPSK